MSKIFIFLTVSKTMNLKLISVLKRVVLLIIFGSNCGNDISIGRGTKFIYGPFSILLVSGTRIGSGCIICPRFSAIRKFPYQIVPVIGDEVFIGPNVVIQGPVEIGSNCIIAPNSVVTKSFPQNSIIAGSPAMRVGSTLDLKFNVLNNPKFKTDENIVM